MGRIMAFDFGMKRVGVAVSDPLKIIANTLETQDTRNIYDFVKKYCADEDVECFVVGYPYNFGHQENEVAGQIEKFIGKLKVAHPEKQVHKVDERYTSKMAAQTLRMSGVNRKERHNKKNVDAISANLILQSYLENPVK